MGKLGVVIQETYRKNVKSWSFLVLVLAPFLMVGFTVLMGYFGGSAASNTIAVISSEDSIRKEFIKASDDYYTIDQTIQTEKSAKEAIKNKEIDGYLVIDLQDDKVKATFYDGTKLSEIDTTYMQSYMDQLNISITSQSLGLSQSELATLFSPAEFQTERIGESQDNDSKKMMILTFGAMGVCLLIYMILLLYGSVLTTEVASEKGTRIMEVLLSSTKASTQFYGKIIGVILVCLTQLAIYVVSAIIGFQLFKDSSMIQDFLQIISVKELVSGFIGYNALYLIIGIIGYCTLAALCGSLVSKAEDSSKAFQPVTMLIMVGFFIGFSGISNADTAIMKISSFVPFISPMVMPFRIAQGLASVSEIWLSIGISVVVTGIVLVLAARLYTTHVLVYNDNGFFKSLKQSISILQNEKIKK